MTSLHSYNPFAGYESKQVEIAKAKANEVPTGTVPEILEWVGDDKDRAARVLADEEKNKKPRKGLVSELKDIIGD